jgi:hypothetical protein
MGVIGAMGLVLQCVSFNLNRVLYIVVLIASQLAWE